MHEANSKWKPVPNEFHGCLLNDVHVEKVREVTEEDLILFDSAKRKLKRQILNIKLICFGICSTLAIAAAIGMAREQYSSLLAFVIAVAITILFFTPFAWLLWNDKSKIIKTIDLIANDKMVLAFPTLAFSSIKDTVSSFGFDLGGSIESDRVVEVGWPSSYIFRIDNKWANPPEFVPLTYVSEIPERARMSALYASTIGPDFKPQFRELTDVEIAEIRKIEVAESGLIFTPLIAFCFLVGQASRLSRAPVDEMPTATKWLAVAAIGALAVFLARGIPSRSRFVWLLRKDRRSGNLIVFREPEENRPVEMLIHSKLTWSVDLEPSGFRRQPFRLRIPFREPESNRHLISKPDEKADR